MGESPIIGYKILWNGGSGSAFSTLATHTNLANLNFFKDNNILGGITYEFKVVAVNIVGDSPASPPLAILAAQPPTEPLNVLEKSKNKTSISIQWSAPSSDGATPITGYLIYWDNATGTMLPESIGSTSWSTLTFTKTGLQTDMYYTFAVSAVNVVGESPQTESVAIITATIPGTV
jgi:titin